MLNPALVSGTLSGIKSSTIPSAASKIKVPMPFNNDLLGMLNREGLTHGYKQKRASIDHIKVWGDQAAGDRMETLLDFYALLLSCGFI